MNVCLLEKMCFKLKGRDKKKFERQGNIATYWREGLKKNKEKILFLGGGRQGKNAIYFFYFSKKNGLKNWVFKKKMD